MSRSLRLLLITALLTAAAVALPAAAGAAGTVWLCRPGVSPDPCTPGLSTTRFTPSGTALGTSTPKADRRPKIDCFYVYPTVSGQPTINADLTIDPEQRSIALYQAARYSQHCRVYAPMYRQLTLKAIGGSVSQEAAAIAYGDVRAAWREYLRRDNKGRGVVLIGHSQGTFMLRRLIRDEVDGKAAVRRRLVSAILLGGNVLVKQGTGIGGDFKRIGACRRASQTGCVIAFSTFNQPVPQDASFGRPAGRGVTATGSTAGMQVLCTNPAALRGGSALLDPIYPSAPFAPGSTIAAGISLMGATLPTAGTTWIDTPGAYRGRCSTADGASVLQVTAQGGAPVFKPSPTPGWGLHLVDANIALGDLVRVVGAQAKAYAAGR